MSDLTQIIPQTKTQRFRRTKPPKPLLTQKVLMYPQMIQREINNRSFYQFLKYFWDEVSTTPLVDNWHIKYLCDELQKVAERVMLRLPKLYDLVINIPPGTTKTSIVLIMFPVWVWTRAFKSRFLTVSYSAALSLESAELSRDLIRSEMFKRIYPEIAIKQEKDSKSNYKVIKSYHRSQSFVKNMRQGGTRFSTSVGGTLTGFHGDFLLVDDPINPKQAVSTVMLENVNRWIDQTLSTRKVDKAVSVTILVMQRLHQNDPSGHFLKNSNNVKHICLPGELGEYEKYVSPKELVKHYKNGLLDPVRLNRPILKELEAALGQYGYAGQVGQNPVPPGGGMFKIEHFQMQTTILNPVNKIKTVRYWDKAGTADGGAYTVGVKLTLLKHNKFLVEDVKRGQWSSEERERIIKQTAEADGRNVVVMIEQEPGSGGKESAENTVRNLAGFVCKKDRPSGDKVYRADPLSVQVNSGNVLLLPGSWNDAYKEEFRYFPFGTYKDQVDATAGAFNFLTGKRQARVI